MRRSHGLLFSIIVLLIMTVSTIYPKECKYAKQEIDEMLRELARRGCEISLYRNTAICKTKNERIASTLLTWIKALAPLTVPLVTILIKR